MFSPVARAIRCRAAGLRPMPRQVGSTTVDPALVLEGEQLGDRQRLVVERAIVEIDERVHPQLADDALVHGLGREMLALRLGRADATSSGSR